ncbi:MAG: hypothetical protein KA100_04355 [Rickettsiales bacterium]|nr:hypothetical protein [Rickettsiales bacterium]
MSKEVITSESRLFTEELAKRSKAYDAKKQLEKLANNKRGSSSVKSDAVSSLPRSVAGDVLINEKPDAQNEDEKSVSDDDIDPSVHSGKSREANSKHDSETKVVNKDGDSSSETSRKSKNDIKPQASDDNKSKASGNEEFEEDGLYWEWSREDINKTKLSNLAIQVEQLTQDLLGANKASKALEDRFNGLEQTLRSLIASQVSRKSGEPVFAAATPSVNIANVMPSSASEGGLLSRVVALESQVKQLMDAQSVAAPPVNNPAKTATSREAQVSPPPAEADASKPKTAPDAPGKTKTATKKDAGEEDDSKWLKTLPYDKFRKEHSYLFDKTVDENGLNNLSLIPEIISQKVELYESGMAVFCFLDREGLVNLNQNIESAKIENAKIENARDAAKGRNPVMSMAKVVNPNGNNIPPEEYYLVFSSPQHGVSITVVPQSVAEGILTESDNEFKKSAKVAAKIKVLKKALKYLEEQASLSAGGEGSVAGDEGSVADDEGSVDGDDIADKIKELKSLIEKAEASISSDEKDVWSKRLDKNYSTRSEVLEEVLEEVGEYDLKSSFSRFLKGGEEWAKILTEEAMPAKIDKATANKLRKRCAYKEVDANEKCEDLTYTQTERAQVISKVTAWSFDPRGKKQERFEKSLDAATMWSGKNPGLSYRRPHDNDDVASVVFTGADGGKKPYDGNDIMYLKIRGTTEADDYYVKVQVATAEREYESYENGKLKPKKCEVGDIIIDKATVFWRDKEGKHHPKPVSELSEFSQKRYNCFNVNAMSVTNGERKTAILFEGDSIPTINLTKVAEVSKTKDAEAKMAFQQVRQISERFDIVIKRRPGKKLGEWVAEGDGKTMYLRDLRDPENLTEISTKGKDADLFKILKDKGCDEELIKSLTDESKKSFAGQKISTQDFTDRPFLKLLEKKVNPKAQCKPRHAITLSEQLRSRDDGAGTKGGGRD